MLRGHFGLESPHHGTAYNLTVAVILVLFAGFASGMTVGLLSLDPIQLKVLKQEGDNDQRQRVTKLERVLSKHHLLLVTLLLSNAIAMEALPLFLNKTVPEWMAVFLSVTAILLFGEILPQALCTGKYQLAIVMKALPIVDTLIYLLFVISWPIAKLLDALLGNHEQQFYARSHLKALIRLHQKGNRSLQSLGGGEVDSALGADEVVIIEGALDLATKHVREIMVPLVDVFMLEWDTRLTSEVRREILERGHSRIPLYKGQRHNVRGLLLVKSLIAIDSCEAVPTVGELLGSTRPPIFCFPNLQLYDLLNEFQRGRHMAFVTTDPEAQRRLWAGECEARQPELLGIATLEDVIEELIQEEIYDEFDHYTSTHLAPPQQHRTLPRSASLDSIEKSPPRGARSERGKRSADGHGKRSVEGIGKRSVDGMGKRLQNPRLLDLQKRLIDEPDESLFPSEEHRPILFKSVLKQNSFIEDNPRKFSADSEPSDPLPRGLKNLVGIAAAKRGPLKSKLCTIHSHAESTPPARSDSEFIFTSP